MKIEWLMLAEGYTRDARGAITFVGVAQNVFLTDSFPAATRRAIGAQISGIEPDQVIEVAMSVISPTGRVIDNKRARLEVGPTPFADASSLGLVAPMQFSNLVLTEYGTHVFRCELTDPDDKVTINGEVELHVIDPSSLFWADEVEDHHEATA